MIDWQPIETAPKDGTEIYLPIPGRVRAFWDDKLQHWVLCRPLHMESLKDPLSWMPVQVLPPLTGKK